MSEKKYEGFTLGLALVDLLPVIFFGASVVLIGIVFQSPLFIVGAALAFLAGFLKVLWKVILALAGKDVKWMNKQMRILMPAGFLLIIASVIIGWKKISWAAVGAAVTSLPSLIFFILWFLGLVAMGVLAGKLDSSVAKNNWIEQGVNSFAQLMGLLGILFIMF
mgnify:CR=1 FL=1